MKKVIITLFVLLTVAFVFTMVYPYLRVRQFDTIKLEKEPDGIFCSRYTERLAVVTDGVLTIYDETGTGKVIDTDLYITSAFPIENSVWVIDDKKNLYEIYDKAGDADNVSEVILSEVKYFSCIPNGNELYCYCAINEDGDLYGWGYNGNYNLGIEGNGTFDTPVKIDYMKDCRKVYFTNGATYVLTNDAEVYEAGIGNYVEVKDENNCSQYVPEYMKRFTKVDELTGTQEIYEANNDAIAVVGDRLKIWCFGEYSQIDRSLSDEKHYKDLGIYCFSSGAMYALGLSEDGDVYYWGYDILNAPKNKGTPWVSKPTRIKEIENAEMIYAGCSTGYVKKGLDIIILKQE